MEKRNGFHRLRPVPRSALPVVIIAIGLVLAGCGEETARIEEQQVQLQVMAKTNAQHIKALAGVIEQNHQKLMSGIEAVQKEIDSLDARALAVGDEQVKLQKVQVKLQEAVQNTTRQLTTKLTAIEQNQDDLLAGMEAVQNDTKQVATDITSVADDQAKLYAGITAVSDEQARLYQTVQSNSQQLVDTSTAIEQNRQEWQTTMGGLQENIQQVANNMNTLSSDLLKLQDILQGNIRELVSMMDASSEGQLEFQDKTRSGLQALDASLSAVQESQSTLQSQVDDVQRSTETLSREIPAVIEQLTDEISNIKMGETDEFIETEPFVSPDSEDI